MYQLGILVYESETQSVGGGSAWTVAVGFDVAVKAVKKKMKGWVSRGYLDTVHLE